MMYLKISGLMLTACLVFFSCAKKVSTTTETKTTTQTVKSNSTTVTPPATNEKFDVPKEIEQNVVAMLKRTPCFGKCPSYEVKIFDNGTAIYTGFAFVEKIGKYEAKVSNDFINHIQQEAQKNTFSAFSQKYPVDGSTLTDIPSTISYVRTGKKGNRVVNNYDAPKELVVFENWLENEIQNLDWKKISN